MRKPTKSVAEALAVTIEACGAEMSEPAVRIMLADLAEHPEALVLAALQRTRREHKGRFSLGAVMERIDDGRPGVEVAWAMVPRSERETAVLTTEMLRALAVAQPLLNEGDEIAARMAFKEAYGRELEQARAARAPVQWQPSVGWDQGGRAAPLGDAVRTGRITLSVASQYLDSDSMQDMLAIAGVTEHPALAAPKTLPPAVSAAIPDKRVPTVAQPQESEADRLARIEAEKRRIRKILSTSAEAEGVKQQ